MNCQGLKLPISTSSAKCLQILKEMECFEQDIRMMEIFPYRLAFKGYCASLSGLTKKLFQFKRHGLHVGICAFVHHEKTSCSLSRSLFGIEMPLAYSSM